MTVGARLGDKARSRFSRRGTGDDQVSILPGGEEEEEEAAGSGAGAPEEEEKKDKDKEEGAGRRKVRFALLPDPYEPLRPPRAPGKRHYGKRLKKYGKEQSISFFHDGFDTSSFQHGDSDVTHMVQFLDTAYSLSYHSDDIPKGKAGHFGFGSEDQHLKNVGKALQKGCRYLVVGLQGLASAYSAPFGVAAQVASFVR